MSLRIEENWKWSIKTLPHTFLCTTHCGILFDFKQKPALGITGAKFGQKVAFFGTIFSLITFLLRGRMKFYYHVNKFLTVSLHSVIFT